MTLHYGPAVTLAPGESNEPEWLIEDLGGAPELANEATRTQVESAVLDLIREDDSPALARAA